MASMTPDELDKLAARWAITLRDDGHAVNTVKARISSVRSFAAWQRKHGKSGLDHDGARGFIASILDRDGARTTAAIRATSLRLFAAWLAAEGHAESGQLAALKIPKPGSQLVPKLSGGELEELIAVCAASATFTARRDETIIRLAAEIPVRAEELVMLDLPWDIDRPQQLAYIRRAKGNKQRMVPFSDATACSLDRYLRMRSRYAAPDEGPLWISQRGGRLNYAGLYASLVRRAEAAGIKGFHPHRLRHTAAVRWLQHGGSEGSLMIIGGWERREMLDRYVADARADLAVSEARHILEARRVFAVA
jgi:integrase/recombinase XerD